MIKELIIKIIYKFNKTKVIRKMGVTLGDNNRFISKPDFGTEPWLITIGNNNIISSNVQFINHDGSTSILRRLDPKYSKVHKFGYIEIGNNNFIGTGTTILPDVTIGDYCIVGAKSLVTKSIPSHEVWGGAPAHFICKIEELAEKRLSETPYYDTNVSKKEYSIVIANYRQKGKGQSQE